MKETIRRSAASPTGRGAGLVLLGAVLGAAIARVPLGNAFAADPARPIWSHERPIRALSFNTNEVVLVESGGVYFVVNSRGAASPVRYRTTDLTNPPGESALITP